MPLRPVHTLLGTAARRRLLGPQIPDPGDVSNQVPSLLMAANRLPNPAHPPVTPPVVPSTVAGGSGGQVGGGASSFGGITPLSVGGATPRWQTWAPAAPGEPIGDVVESAMEGVNLTADPQLPASPLGVYTDSQYEAENAVLGQQINAAYQDILQQTGYDGPGGQHIAGDIELDAARQERDLLTGYVNASDEVTGSMQQAGTIFSGYHGNQRAKAQQPYVTGLGDLSVNVPRTLSRAVSQASELMREYALQRNMLLMQAAWRKAALLAQSQGKPAPAPPPGASTMGSAVNIQPVVPLPDSTVSGFVPGTGGGGVIDPTYTIGPPIIPNIPGAIPPFTDDKKKKQEWGY